MNPNADNNMSNNNSLTNKPNAVVEPDFFQDMLPEIKKPKTVILFFKNEI